MSEVKKPSFMERLLGGGTPSSPEPSSPAKEPPAKELEKKEPRERTNVLRNVLRQRLITSPSRRSGAGSPSFARGWREARLRCPTISPALSPSESSTRRLLDQLEEVLIKADLGVAMAGRIRDNRRQRPL